MPLSRCSTQLLLLAVLAISGCRNKGLKAPEGDIVAALTPLPTADGSTFDAQTLRGKPTLVLFALPTCGYCIKEMPIAMKAAAEEKANLIAVFIGGGKQHAASVTKSSGFTAPVLFDEGKHLSKQYAIKGVPYTLVLGADGFAREAFRGEQDEETLRDAIDAAR